ncbi:MAG: sulfotransferase [Pseudomonadota bacterium]
MTHRMTKPRPDFAVIGAMRAGTTQLYELLRQHPGICVPQMKETDFFCSHKSVARGLDWYWRQFSDEGALWGDISPNYAKTDVNPDAAALLHDANPDMKLFFIARDPVDRAVSHYNMAQLVGDTPGDPHRLLSSWSGKHILHASQYYTCLLPFWERFGEQITILDFDTLVRAPDTVIAKMCEALGIEHIPTKTKPASENSLDDVARRPVWWHKLRRTPLGTELRGRVPRPLLNMAKRHVARRYTAAKTQALPEAIRDAMAERLSGDASRFRQETGLSFDRWSV